MSNPPPLTGLPSAGRSVLECTFDVTMAVTLCEFVADP